jgi:hypothetical protein
LNLVCCDLTNYFGILNWLCSDLDLIKHPSFCFSQKILQFSWFAGDLLVGN